MAEMLPDVIDSRAKVDVDVDATKFGIKTATSLLWHLTPSRTALLYISPLTTPRSPAQTKAQSRSHKQHLNATPSSSLSPPAGPQIQYANFVVSTPLAQFQTVQHPV